MSPLGKLVSLVRPKKVVIENPVIGFLNLLTTRGDAMVREDREHLAPLFVQAKASSGIVPYCHVLFIYADIEVTGYFVNSPLNLADIVNGSNASIVVVASPNETDPIVQAGKPKRTRAVNLVFTGDRRHGVFAQFFAKLFRHMWDGKSMPQAWAEIAPQGPLAKHTGPSTFMIAEAGHLVFERADANMLPS